MKIKFLISYTEILVRVNLFIQVFLFCLLEVGLFLNDFSLSYVANYSAESTPPLYKFASLWGSLDGSILLWNLCLSLFMYFYLKLYKDPSSNIDIKIFTLIMIFFVGYTVFSSSPFAGCIELATIGCSTSTILEQYGISDNWFESRHTSIRIRSTNNVDSLNASTAAAIGMWELTK